MLVVAGGRSSLRFCVARLSWRCFEMWFRGGSSGNGERRFGHAPSARRHKAPTLLAPPNLTTTPHEPLSLFLQVARDLEEPFMYPPNNLPCATWQDDFNCRLAASLQACTMGEGQDGTPLPDEVR